MAITLDIEIKKRVEIDVEIPGKLSAEIIVPNSVVGAVLPKTYNWPPPTGQTSSFRTGDDFDIESTLFAAARVVGRDPKLVDFFNLLEDNTFGNKQRFTDISGGTDYNTLNYFICNYNGLGWSNVILTAKNWNDHIDSANALVHAGFDDWFVPNYHQLLSIMKPDQPDFIFDWSASEAGYPIPIDEISNSGFWVSTTSAQFGSFAPQARRNAGFSISSKTGVTQRTWYCRKHF